MIWSLSTFSACCFAWQTTSRELVDLQFAADNSLIILVSAPGATEPGIYRWRRGEAEPKLLCHLASPVSFSFDRKSVVERVAEPAPELRIYDASTCAPRSRIPVDGAVLDADARGKLVAAAFRLPDHSRVLRLYTMNGRALASTAIGANVEIGFTSDGRSLLNFDLNDGGLRAWQLPTLADQPLPRWLGVGELTFVPGSPLVKRYVNDTLTLHRWPGGAPVFAMALSRAPRIRQLSASGRYGLAHVKNGDGEALEWLDFPGKRRVRLAVGSVDHAAINGAGNRVAWTSRTLHSEGTAHAVQVQFATLDGDGRVAGENDTSVADRAPTRQ